MAGHGIGVWSWCVNSLTVAKWILPAVERDEKNHARHILLLTRGNMVAMREKPRRKRGVERGSGQGDGDVEAAG